MRVQGEDRRETVLINLTASIGATAAATLLRFAIAPLVGSGLPFITYFCAALALSWYCDFFSAALCVVLGSALGASYFLVHGQPGIVLATRNDWAAIIGFAVLALTVSLLLYLLRAALRRSLEAESSEREQRRWFQATLASIGEAVITTDLKGRILHTNRIAEALLGWTEQEMVGQPLEEFFRIIDEATGKILDSPVPAAIKQAETVRLPERCLLQGRNGSKIPIDDSAAPIRDSEGHVTGTVLVFRDVTARRRAEESMRQLASIVESSQDAIIGHDLNGRFTSWNQGAERIFGYSAEEIIGHPSSRIASPETGDEIPDSLRRIQAHERVEPYQAVRRTKSGNSIDVSITISPIRDEMGRIVGASKIARDISAEVRAAQQLATANASLQLSNEQLARFNEDLERFAFVASHDLQEPLRMMTVYSQLLVRAFPGELSGDVAQYVEYITGGSRRMRDLLADLLAFAQLGARGELPTASTDLNVVLDKVTQNLRAAIDESGVTIRADLLPVVSVYEGHFIALFQNLIGNAIKYRSAAKPEVRIFVEELNGEWRFGVADNGIGIESEYLDNIFAPFKRLHGGDIPGSGIGLAICQRVVERYGGRIWAESEAGRGSTFLFTLPQSARAKAEGG